VSSDRAIHCPDFARRFDGFFDGELDPHSLRSMALHASQCAQCGAELARAERLQELLSGTVEDAVEYLDAAALWPAIESRLRARRPLRARARAALSALPLRPVPALVASGAVAAALAVWLWPGSTEPESVEIANNHAQIERIESSAPHVAVWSEPERHTTAIWVVNYEPEGAP
jgi:anti-sigma factor RsiW